MKRIQSACLLQTIRFQQKDSMESEAMEKANRMEFERYQAQLSRGYVKFEIVSEQVLPDGTLEVQLKKQYNSYSTDGYIG